MAFVVVDIETLSRHAGGAIISIGAVRCDAMRGILKPDYAMDMDTQHRVREQNQFSRIISLDSCSSLGMGIENTTLGWWLEQSKEARAALSQAVNNGAQAQDIRQVLADFKAWLEIGEGCEELYSWHSVFDMGILKAAYLRCREFEPWDYRKERDAYTLAKACPDVPAPSQQGTRHDALDDAVWAARYVISCKQYMKKAQQGVALVNGMEMQRELAKQSMGQVGQSLVPRDAYGFEVVDAGRIEEVPQDDAGEAND